MKFHQVIRERRWELKRSQRWVGQQVGVTKQAVWEWEHTVMPTDPHLDKLCTVLGLDYELMRELCDGKKRQSVDQV